MVVPDLFQRGFIKDTSGTALSDWKWIIDNGTRIWKTGNAIAATTTIHTVPAGKNFYLLSATIYAAIDGAGGDIADFLIGGTIVLRITFKFQPDSFVFPITLTTPIQVTAGETIQITSPHADISIGASVAGYEV